MDRNDPHIEKALIEDLIRLSNQIRTAIKIGKLSDAGISEIYDIYCCFRGVYQDEYHDKIFCYCKRLAHDCDTPDRCKRYDTATADSV